MTDREFLECFEQCTLDDFTHRDHVRLAWLALRADGRDEAAERVRNGIRRYATHHGAADKYHETITLAWLEVVADAIAATPDQTDFEDFLAAHPALLERKRLLEHYSAEVLASDVARRAWVEPDRRPFAARSETR